MKTKRDFGEYDHFRTYRETINRDSTFLRGQIILSLIILSGAVLCFLFFT